jgi:hypothetical protein
MYPSFETLKVDESESWSNSTRFCWCHWRDAARCSWVEIESVMEQQWELEGFEREGVAGSFDSSFIMDNHSHAC